MADSQLVRALEPSDFNAALHPDSGAVLIDFWAPWCGPCRSMAPNLEVLAGLYEGKLSVRSINIDQAVQLSDELGVRSIPALYLFKNGELIDQKVGLQPPHALLEFVRRAFLSH